MKLLMDVIDPPKKQEELKWNLWRPTALTDVQVTLDGAPHHFDIYYATPRNTTLDLDSLDPDVLESLGLQLRIEAAAGATKNMYVVPTTCGAAKNIQLHPATCDNQAVTLQVSNDAMDRIVSKVKEYEI